MITKTSLSGLCIVATHKHVDHRGVFNRIYDETLLSGLNIRLVIRSSNIVVNDNQYTLRGMHSQAHPYAEAKLVSCIHGSIYDVAIDLRKDSDTYLHWHGEYLNGDDNKQILVPEGFLHGYLTLEPNSIVAYSSSSYYVPDSEVCYRWDDPAFSITWPAEPLVISEKDLNYLPF